MFWIVRPSCGPSDRPGCESISTQSCPVWECGEAVTEEHWGRRTGGSAARRVPPWHQTGVSCFFTISKSSEFLTRLVGHGQAVLIGSMVSSCSRGLPMSGGKAQMRLLTPSQGQQPLTGSHHCAPLALLWSCSSSAQQVQRVPWAPAWLSWWGLRCCPRCWAHTASPARHSHKTRLYLWISSLKW